MVVLTVQKSGSKIQHSFCKQSCRFEGAESFDAVAARVKDFFDSELTPLAGRFTRVLAVAHGGILRTVLRDRKSVV